MPATDNLWTALRAFQADPPHIPLDAKGNFGNKFASLPNILKIVGPKLAEVGLAWTAKPSMDDQGRPTLKYKLAHAATGECEEDEMPLMLSKQDAQGQGSGITYARRYALLSVLNLAGDEDDDGTSASQQAPPQRQQKPRAVPSRPSDVTDEAAIQAVKSELDAVEVLDGEPVPVVIDEAAANDLIAVIRARKLTAGQVRGFLKGAGVQIGDKDDTAKAIRNLTLDQWSKVSKGISVLPVAA